MIDTSGAYIPGHGTPTVILFGRNRKPVGRYDSHGDGDSRRAEHAGRSGARLVWSAIVEQIDQPGSQSEFVSVGDSSRELFGKHPWSIGGGGAAELKEQLEESAATTLGTICTEHIGFVAVNGEDDALFACRVRNVATCGRGRFSSRWSSATMSATGASERLTTVALFPYDDQLELRPIDRMSQHGNSVLAISNSISQRRRFGRPIDLSRD